MAWNRLRPVDPSREDFAAIYRDYLAPGSPQLGAPQAEGTGPGFDAKRVDELLEEAGFTVWQRTYQRQAHYERDQWLDLVFTYSNHLVLPSAKAIELRDRLAERIGPDGVTAGGDTLLVTARPRAGD